MLTIEDLRRTGRYKTPTVEDRFWDRVVIAGPDDCWEWQGSRNRGYGLLGSHGLSLRANRVAYVLGHGPIPDGFMVMHSCDNPPCCNPAHLSLGTGADNTADAVAKGRMTGAPKGLANIHGKLTDDDVRAIRAARAAGEPCRSVAERFGIHPVHVSYIATGRRRASVQ